MKIYITKGVGFISSQEMDVLYERFVKDQANRMGLNTTKYFNWVVYKENNHLTKGQFEKLESKFNAWCQTNNFLIFCLNNADCQQVEIINI